jgi:hypothetical protein
MTKESWNMKTGALISTVLQVGSAVAAVLFLFIGIVTPTTTVIAGIGAAALIAAAVSTWKKGLDFLSLSQYMYGLSFLAVSLAGAGGAGTEIDLVRAVFLSSLGIGILVSLLPVSRSLVDIAIDLRRFPRWFKATVLYRVMDVAIGIAGAAVLLIGAVLFYFHMNALVKTLMMIFGLGCELFVIVLLKTHGYRYLDFLTGRAQKERS